MSFIGKFIAIMIAIALILCFWPILIPIGMLCNKNEEQNTVDHKKAQTYAQYQKTVIDLFVANKNTEMTATEITEKAKWESNQKTAAVLRKMYNDDIIIRKETFKKPTYFSLNSSVYNRKIKELSTNLDTEETIAPINKNKQDFIKKERAKMTKTVRERILQRDNYTCQCCGLSRKDEPHLLLEVDHIVPVSKGGRTVDWNLQTLCWQCNRQKSNKIIRMAE